MILTIFADASFCDRTHAAGWGAWYKHGNMDAGVMFGGQVAETVTNASEAEIYAIAHALDTAARRGAMHLPVDAVMLQSDCLRALQLILKCVPNSQERRHKHSRLDPITGRERIEASVIERGALFIIQGVVERHKTFVRHVKGHQQGEGRSWVNRQCDETARLCMRDARNRIMASGAAP